MLVLASVGTVLSFAKFGYYAFVRRPPDPVVVAPASRAQLASLVIIAVPSVLFGLFPGVFLGAFAGSPGTFEPYAASELAKALAVTVAGVVGFALVRKPLTRVHPVDVDRILNPAGATLATATSALAVDVGGTAARRGAALLGRLGSLAGRDPVTAETPLRTALWALAATAGLALLVVALT